jgi:hypothetical protein
MSLRTVDHAICFARLLVMPCFFSEASMSCTCHLAFEECT